jgi:hypothetical protein
MSFKYLGGDCDESDNSQTVLFFGCANGRDGRVPNKMDAAYIEVESVLNERILFSGTVDIGGVFTVEDGGAVLPDMITIGVFDSSGTDSTRLQTVIMNPSCQTSLLFMNDQFGAQQVVAWETQMQGVVDSTVPQTLTLTWTITNIGDVDETLETLMADITEAGTPFSSVDLDLANVVLAPDASESVSQDIPDVSLDDGRRTFLVATEVTGNSNGSACTGGVDETEFSVGFA